MSARSDPAALDQDVVDVRSEFWNVVLNRVPEDIVADTIIAMDDPMPHPHDLPEVGDVIDERRIFLPCLAQRLADDLEESFDDQAKTPVAEVVVQGLASGERE